jgi:hypothetical protein
MIRPWTLGMMWLVTGAFIKIGLRTGPETGTLAATCPTTCPESWLMRGTAIIWLPVVLVDFCFLLVCPDLDFLRPAPPDEGNAATSMIVTLVHITVTIKQSILCKISIHIQQAPARKTSKLIEPTHKNNHMVNTKMFIFMTVSLQA